MKEKDQGSGTVIGEKPDLLDRETNRQARYVFELVYKQTIDTLNYRLRIMTVSR